MDNYQSVLTVTALGAGASIDVPHGLIWRGNAAIPDAVGCFSASPLVVTAADDTNVTVHNPTAGALSAVFVATFQERVQARQGYQPRSNSTPPPGFPQYWSGNPGGSGTGSTVVSDWTATAAAPVALPTVGPTSLGTLTFPGGTVPAGERRMIEIEGTITGQITAPGRSITVNTLLGGVPLATNGQPKGQLILAVPAPDGVYVGAVWFRAVLYVAADGSVRGPSVGQGSNTAGNGPSSAAALTSAGEIDWTVDNDIDIQIDVTAASPGDEAILSVLSYRSTAPAT